MVKSDFILENDFKEVTETESSKAALLFIGTSKTLDIILCIKS